MVAHINVAENFIKDIQVANNKYDSPSNIVCDGKNSVILAKCASWTSGLLQHTYGCSNTFKQIFGVSGPQSAEYHDIIVNQTNFKNIQKVTDMEVRYDPTLMISKKPIISNTIQYSVWITDMTSSYHSKGDSREPPTGTGAGVGSGEFRLYADTNSKNIVGYTWSLSSGSTHYPKTTNKDASGRDVVVGRLDQIQFQLLVSMYLQQYHGTVQQKHHQPLLIQVSR
eukprot:gene1753-522_t